MKKFTRYSVIALALMSLSTACKTSSTSSTPTDGGGVSSVATALTIAQVTGSHTAACFPISTNNYGTALNGTSIYRSISLNANSTYSMSTLLFLNGSCNAVQAWSYTQFGTYTLGSLLSSGATAVLYVSGSSSLTVYGGTTGGGATASVGDGWSTKMSGTGAGGYCPGGPTFLSGAVSSRSMSGFTCNTGTLLLSPFPVDGTNSFDAISLDTAGLFKVSTPLGIFQMGQYSSYPTTTPVSFTF